MDKRNKKAFWDGFFDGISPNIFPKKIKTSERVDAESEFEKIEGDWINVANDLRKGIKKEKENQENLKY